MYLRWKKVYSLQSKTILKDFVLNTWIMFWSVVKALPVVFLIIIMLLGKNKLCCLFFFCFSL